MTPPKILNLLSSGETIIYERTGGFDFEGKSIVGTHTLCITSNGKIHVHDTGGLFGSDQVRTSSAHSGKIQLQYFSFGANLKSASSHPFSFDFTIPYEELLEVLRKLPLSCFTMEKKNAAAISAFITYGAQPYTYVELLLKRTGIEVVYPLEFSRSALTLPLHRITQINPGGQGDVTFEGHFEADGTTQSRIRLFIPEKDKISAIQNLFENAPKLSDLIQGGMDAVFPVKFTGMIHETIQKQVSLTLIVQGNKLTLADEQEMKVVQVYALTEYELYYDKKNHCALLVRNDAASQICFEGKEAVAYADQAWSSGQLLFLSEPCELDGVFQGRAYQKEAVCLAGRQESSVRLLFLKEMRLSSEILERSRRFVTAADRLLLHQDREIFMLTCTNADWKKLISPYFPQERCAIGYTQANEPFYAEQNDKSLVFHQSAQIKLLEIENTDILDISMMELASENQPFLKTKIQSGRWGDTFVYIAPDEVASLVNSTYSYSKAPLVVRTSMDQLYLSWSRHMNDYLSYHLFGQLFALQAGIGEIRKQPDRDDRNRTLLNFMYYSVQTQKRRLDEIAIYLPALLEQNCRTLLTEAGYGYDETPFVQMQQRILGISSRMKGSLLEIENALTAVSEVIIPKADMEGFIRHKEKRGYGLSILSGGVAVGLVSGGIATPLFLIGSAVGALNTYFSASDARRLEQMKEENLYHRLDFQMQRALDAFDHFMQTLLPYYVAEVNRSMLQHFNQIAALYKPAIHDVTVKNKLFAEMAQYYTFKELPIDESVTTKRKALIEEIDATSQTATRFINHFKQEVNYDVRKQAEIRRLESV